MSLYVMGLTIRTVGEILIGYSALRVHAMVRKEHKIDKKVLSNMKSEEFFAVLGILLLVVGFLVEISSEI